MSPLALFTLLALVPLSAQGTLQIDGLPVDGPLSLSARASATELTVEVRLRPEWHLYGRDGTGGQPIGFVARAASAFALAGEPTVAMDADGRITGSATITQPLRRTGAGAHLAVEFHFMACDPLMCLPPMRVTLSGEVAGAAPRVLLVVTEAGDRSARIAAFLGERGFACAVVPYAEVTKDLCDAHDVVVADSPYFDSARGARRAVLAFPRTTAPIVAVGYLGTELLEAHKIAMACGYI